MSAPIAVELRIEGGVQGVGYRAFTKRAADELGVVGWVRNRRDGCVEALVCGSPEAVGRLIEQCRTGPRLAAVSRIEIREVAGGGAGPSFEIRATV